MVLAKGMRGLAKGMRGTEKKVRGIVKELMVSRGLQVSLLGYQRLAFYINIHQSKA